jgi:hypothetical protein
MFDCSIIRIKNPAALCLVISLTAAVVRADLVETTDRHAMEGRVAAVAEDGVHLASGATLAWDGVKRVVFDRPSVVAANARLRLNDGTFVCGVVRGFTSAHIVFRSVSMGEMDVPLTRVAALQFAGSASLATVGDASSSNIVVLLKSGLVRRGVLVAASASNMLLKTKDGMEKLALDNVESVVFGRSTPAGMTLILRNGDQLCAKPEWQNGNLRVNAGGATVTVALEALAEIRK